MVKIYNRAGGIATYGGTSVVLTFSDGMCVASVAASTGDNPVPDDDTAPEIPTLDFEFGTAIVDADSNTVELDPYEGKHVESFNGLEIITDGVTRNMEYDGSRVCNLEIEAPKTAPSVAVDTPAGSGITGNYKYVVRFKNSKTGKVSGFSPSTDEVSPSSQEVNITSIEVSGDGQVDYIELFRSLSDDYSAFYFIAEVANSGTPTYTDEDTDETIETNERHDLVQGRTFNEGLMPPVLKGKNHLGAVYYFGLRRLPTYAVGTVSGTAGNNYVEMDANTGCLIDEARRGFKMKVSGSDIGYRIIGFDFDSSPQKVYLYPSLPTGFSPSNASYTVEDDRDGRKVRVSEFGWNGSVPTEHEFSLGADIEDILVDMFVLGKTAFFGSLNHIFQIEGDKTTAPWETTQKDAVVDEGPCGPKAGTVVPGVGYVYLDRKLGPRVFDGQRSYYLGTDREETTILTEWRRFRNSRKWYSVVRYSHDKNLIYFSYSRDDESGLRHVMVFSLATAEWLGPWTIRMSEYGELLHSSFHPVLVFGTDLGGLMQDYKGSRDGFSSGTLSGTLTDVNGRVLTDSAASFLSSGEGLYGAIIELTSPSGTPYYYYAVSNTGNALTSLALPSPTPDVGWSYQICPIPWVCKTGYIDGGNPHNYKVLNTVQARWDRGSAGTVRCAVGSNGDSLYEVGSGEESVASKVHGRFTSNTAGEAFQFQLDGSGNADDPKITNVVTYIHLRRDEPE